MESMRLEQSIYDLENTNGYENVLLQLNSTKKVVCYNNIIKFNLILLLIRLLFIIHLLFTIVSL